MSLYFHAILRAIHRRSQQDVIHGQARRARRFIQELIRTEKARLGLTFEDISDRLRRHGIRQTPTNLRTKLGRGDMGAQLFLTLVKVLEVEELELPRSDGQSVA